jgi:hypothetical protein
MSVENYQDSPMYIPEPLIFLGITIITQSVKTRDLQSLVRHTFFSQTKSK